MTQLRSIPQLGWPAWMTGLVCGLALLTIIPGCGNSSGGNDEPTTPNGEPSTLSTDRLDGQWLLRTMNATDTGFVSEMIAIANVTEADDGTFTLTIRDASPKSPFVRNSAGELVRNGDTLHFRLPENDKVTRDLLFAGQIRPDGVDGGFGVEGGSRPQPLRLVRVPEGMAIQDEMQSKPLAGTDLAIPIFQAAEQGNADGLGEAYLEFLETQPNTLLTVAVGTPTVQTLVNDPKTDAETVRKVVETSIDRANDWGSLIGSYQRAINAKMLSPHARFADLAAELLEELEPESTPFGEAVAWTDSSRLRGIVEQVQLERELKSVDDEARRTEIIAEMVDRANDPTADPYLIYRAAEVTEDAGMLEVTASLLSRLIVMPNAIRAMMEDFNQMRAAYESPITRSRELYKATNGSLDGYDDYLAGRYRELMDEAFPGRVAAPTSENGKTALLELYTNQACMPCTAADLATVALAQRYSQDELIVLRYHAHTAGLDPLTHPDTAARTGVTFYEFPGTPLTVLNGTTRFSLSGLTLTDALAGVDRISETVAEAVEAETDLRIELSADQTDDVVNYTARVIGPTSSPEPRLFLVLAEREIVYAARNGIRTHEMIVRDYLTDATEGEPLTASQTELSGDVSLIDLQTRLTKYLATVENRAGQNFRDKPLALKDLQLVAFVQDIETKEVLQAATIPFGSLGGEAAEPTETLTEAPKLTEPSAREPVSAPKPTTDDSAALTEFGPLQPVAWYDDEPADEASDEKPAEDKVDAEEGEEPEEEPAPRTTYEGRWLFVLTQGGSRNTPVAIVDVATDPKVTAKVIESPRGIRPLAVTKVETTEGDTLHLELTLRESVTLDFEGTLREGTVFGSTTVNGSPASPTTLIAVGDGSLEEILESGFRPAPEGFREFRSIGQTEDPFAAAEAFAKKYPNSPLALDLLSYLLSAEVELTEEQVKQLAEQTAERAEPWGRRLALATRLDTVRTLVGSRQFLDVAGRQLDRYGEALPEEQRTAEQKTTIDELRKDIRLALAKNQFLNGTDEERAAAAEEMKAAEDLDPESAYLLADYAADQKNLKEALTGFTDIAVKPGVARSLARVFANPAYKETPKPAMIRAKALFEELNPEADDDAFDEFVVSRYRELTGQFVTENPDPNPPEDSRTVLVELFTGAMCPPCVSADIATGALEQMYPKTDLIVVRYHYHVPGPDPLTVPGTAERFRNYGLRGTPSVMIDGVQFPPVGGFLEDVPEVRDRIAEKINEARPKGSPLKFNLSATAKDGVITLDAAAMIDGDGEQKLADLGDDLKLRLLLVEEEVIFPARNGIFVHEMVVRDILPDVNGVPLEEGKLSYTGTRSLWEMTRDLNTYLDGYEEESRFRFPIRPLDFEHLDLVAFVQDGDSGPILGAARIPVTGSLEFSEPEPEENDDAEEKDDAEETPQPKPAETE